jgi:carboxypeptidase Q
MKNTTTVLLSLLTTCFIPLNRATAQDAAPAATARVVDRVIAEAMKPSPLESNLRQLTDEIGGRVPGTPAMNRAIDWGKQALQVAGGENIHTEAFQISRSWAEGDTHFWVSAPVQFGVHAVSVAWTPALPLVRHAHIVDVGEGSKDEFARAGDISGSIILVHSKVTKTWADLFEEYELPPPILDQAVQGHAAAVAFIGGRERDLLYRHINIQSGEIDRIPQVIVAREDGLRLARLLATGRQVYADLAIPNLTGGPVSTANVVAEIRGSEKPDEFVILGAHLDSWELGTGALDNGCNASLVIDALRAIRASGIKPRRTIRFVLFSGEEEGLLGSRAYATQHVNELDNMQAAVIFDSGTGHVSGFTLSGRTELASAARELIEPLKQFGATAVTQDADMGTDNFDFLLQGVPTLVADQEPANYMQNYHAMSDTFDKVDLAELHRMVADAAGITIALADRPERFGSRQNRNQIGELLKDTHLDREMKLFGAWSDWESGARGRAR